MKQRILLYDTSAVLHTIKFGIAKRKLAKNEQHTFLIFGFLLKLQFLMKKTFPNVIIFAIDDPKKSNRRRIFPAYKENRSKHNSNKTDAEKKLDSLAYPQFDTIIDFVLPALGFRNIFKAKGLEADDVIARVCKDYANNEIIIVSRDSDLYQLITPTTCLLFPHNNQYFTNALFRRRYHIHPKKWGRVKTLAGCTTDGVPGIDGIGEKRALQYIKNELPENYKAYKNIKSKEGKTIIKRNKKLVVLPFKGTPTFKVKPDHVKKKKLRKVALDYGFASILEDLDEWAKNLRAY